MSRWLDLAAKMQADDETPANSDNSAKSPPDPAAAVANGANDTIGTAPLPPNILAGLKRLRTMAAPLVAQPERWPGVVADAHRLATDGWALAAVNLGWSELDLFGAVVDPAGDPDADGLAVKLQGRRVLAISEAFATVADEVGGRTYLYRGNNDGARLLWALRGRR